MAGHSQFKNIMHRKGAQDKKRAKLFNKIAREITVAVREGSPDPSMNPRLRNAIASAREANMPNDRISRAIKSGTPGGGDDNAVYEYVRYEGYGPGGVAVIAEALTDNRNRTASEVRTAFTKNGGVMGETNSVSFMFDRVGSLFYPAAVAGADAMFEAAAEAGADNVESDSKGHEVITAVESFSAVRDALEKKFGAPVNAGLIWKPKSTVAPGEEAARELLDMIEALEDNDDIQNVFANFDIAEELMEKLVA